MILRVLVLTTTLSLCCNYTKIHTCGLDMKEKKSLVQINSFFTFCLVNVCFFSWPFCNDIYSNFEFGISNLSLNRDVRGCWNQGRVGWGGQGGPSRNGRSVSSSMVWKLLKKKYGSLVDLLQVDTYETKLQGVPHLHENH